MPSLFKPADFDQEKLRKEWAGEFVGACFGCPWDVNRAAADALRGALADGSEGAIQEVLTANPYLIQYAVDHSRSPRVGFAHAFSIARFISREF
jgi:hypothetical protein